MGMWQSIVDQKERWIGGLLVDYGDPMDRQLMPTAYPAITTIKDITVTDTWFEVVGEQFACGGDRKYLGLVPGTKYAEVNLLFSGALGHEWGIVRPGWVKEEESDAQ